MLKKWSVAQLNKDNAIAISSDYNLPMLVSMLLDIRGISDDVSISNFLSDQIILEDPFKIKDMKKAVDRIKSAIEDNEKICIYGDFDADGVTSTALLYSYLSDISANVIYYIPSREEEGYGMNKEAIDKLKSENVKLIITVDNGISAYDEIEYANSLSIDTVITDHHVPPVRMPNAVAIVDLHQYDCQSSFKELSGVGVTLKLIMAIEGEYADIESIIENYSDLAAIGTIGDIVNLSGENRVIVKQGIKYINNRDRLGIKALIDQSGFEDKEITTGNISFSLVPRINAGGRLGDSSKSVEMLLTEDEEKAYSIAQELSDNNSERQLIEKEILSEIDEMIKKNPKLVQNKIIVVSGENWHQGVIGIVASRLKETYLKPAIVISINDDVCRASGRSVKGFSLSDAVFGSGDLLTQYGGHPMAVGFGIKKENIDMFIKEINMSRYIKDIPLPTLSLDCKLNPSQISVPLAEDLKMLAPYGAGNPVPLFGLYNMKIVDIRPIGQGKHLRLTVARNDTVIYCLKFSTTLEEFPYIVGDTVDLAVTIDTNEYNDRLQLNIIVKDLKFSDMDAEKQLLSLSLFEKFCIGERLTKEDYLSLLPNRDEFAKVYRYLKQNNGYTYPIETLLYRVDKDMAYGKLRVILECMNELSLIRIYEGMTTTKIVICEVQNKVSLSDALIIKKLKEVSTNV